MQKLKELNVRKSLDVLEDFHEAVPVDVLDKELTEKKEQAELALKHIGELFREDTGLDITNSKCSAGQCSQNPPHPPGG